MLKNFRCRVAGYCSNLVALKLAQFFPGAAAHEFAGLEAPQPTLVRFPGWPALAEGLVALAVRVGDVVLRRSA